MAASFLPASANGFGGNIVSAYETFLKIQYSKRWMNAFKEGNMIWSKLANDGGIMGGKFTQAAVATTPPQSAGIFVRENRGLPTLRTGTYAGPVLHARDCYTALGWSGNVERAAAAGDKMAFAKPRADDMKNARIQFDINMCFALYDAYYQPRAAISAYNGGTLTATLYGRNDRTASGEAFWYRGSFALRPLMSVGFSAAVSGAPTYDIEGGTTGIVNEVHIASLGGTDSAPTAVLSAAPSVAPAANDLVIPFKSRQVTGAYTSAAADTMLYAGINGVAQLNLDSTIYGGAYDLDRTLAANGFTNGYFNHASGTPRTYSERRIMLAAHKIIDNPFSNGKGPNLAVMENSTVREHVAEHDGDRRFQPVQTEEGYGKLVVMVGSVAVPIESDWMMFPGAVGLFSTECYKWVQQSALGPLDHSDKRWVPNFDQNLNYWHMSGNIECEAPTRQAWVDDLDVDVFALLGE